KDPAYLCQPAGFLAMIDIALATEDELSEAIGLRLIGETAFAASEPLLLRRNGFGYLRSKMSSSPHMAIRQVVVILTDLDRLAYPVALLEDWQGNHGPFPRKLLQRVADREVESWVLDDHERKRTLLGVNPKFP